MINPILRPYQIESIEKVLDAIVRGIDRGLVIYPTGCGKTIFAIELLRLLKLPALFLVHRDELISQTVNTLKRSWPMASVGVVKAELNEHQGYSVVVASVQSLNEKRLNGMAKDQFGVLVVDECFPPGTLIDGKKIELISVGDYVSAWNEETNTIVKKQVTHTFKRKTTTLVKIKSGFCSVFSTLSHPFFTNRGWVQAGKIKPGDILLRKVDFNVNSSAVPVVFQAKSCPIKNLPSLQGKEYSSNQFDEIRSMQLMRKGIYSNIRIPKNKSEILTSCLLFNRMFNRTLPENFIGNDGTNQQELCVRADESSQSNGEFNNKKQSVRFIEKARSQTKDTRREWAGSYIATKDFSESIELALRSSHTDWNETGVWIPYLLQGRHCKSLPKNRHRSGWEFSFDHQSEKLRCKERKNVEWVRVDSVEIHEQGNSDEFERLCPSGEVYNLEVEGVHTYTANGFIVHNCHHGCSPSWTRAIEYFDTAFRLGLTATPDRLDGKGLAALFGREPLYSMQILDAIKRGYLCSISQWAVETEINLDGVETRAGDFVTGQLAAVVNTDERNQAIVESFIKHGEGRRAAVFCVNVQHAYDLALTLNEHGIASAVITGDTPIEERREILERFRAGKLRAITNCEVLTEGWDFPELDCVIPARPTKSRALYQQIIGRGLRPAEGKKDCLILDPTDNCRRHKLVTLSSLLGVKKQDAEGRDVLEIMEEEEEELRRHEELIRSDIRRPIIWRLESICPWPELPSLEGYKPDKPWHNDPASDKQTNWIKKFGLGLQKDFTKGEAGWIIDQCLQFEAAYPTPATSKQEYRLRLEGLWEEGLTKKQASNLIARLRQEESNAV